MAERFGPNSSGTYSESRGSDIKYCTVSRHLPSITPPFSLHISHFLPDHVTISFSFSLLKTHFSLYFFFLSLSRPVWDSRRDQSVSVCSLTHCAYKGESSSEVCSCGHGVTSLSDFCLTFVNTHIQSYNPYVSLSPAHSKVSFPHSWNTQWIKKACAFFICTQNTSVTLIPPFFGSFLTQIYVNL